MKDMMRPQTRILLIILALLLSGWSFGSGEGYDFMTWCGPAMDRWPDLLQRMCCPVLIPLLMLVGFSFMAGTGILALLAWLAIERYLAAHPSALTPLVLPLLSAIWLAVQALPFLRIPPGTSIRPMGWTAYVGMSSLVLMILSIVRTVGEFRKGRNKMACSVALLLSVLVIVVPWWSFHAVVQFRGLILAP